jgi:transcriptional regulator of met regulon
MTTAKHIDFSEIVIEHFNQTGELHPDILAHDSDDLIKELVDAIPEENKELLRVLRGLL